MLSKTWLNIMLSTVIEGFASPRMASRLSLAGINPRHPAVVDMKSMRTNATGSRCRFMVHARTPSISIQCWFLRGVENQKTLGLTRPNDVWTCRAKAVTYPMKADGRPSFHPITRTLRRMYRTLWHPWPSLHRKPHIPTFVVPQRFDGVVHGVGLALAWKILGSPM